MLESYSSVQRLQEFIDEWNDPKDIAQRSAVLLQKVNRFYGKLAFIAFKNNQNNCKHPKKMRDLCADGTVYCMDCNEDLRDDEIFGTKTPTLIKEKVRQRRKLVKKYAQQKLKQSQIAKKLNVSISTVEKDMHALRDED